MHSSRVDWSLLKGQNEAQDFEFIEGWYNPHRLHSALGYDSHPSTLKGRTVENKKSQAKNCPRKWGNSRQQVYRLARERHPNRWSGEIRNWELPEKVWLNPEKEQSDLSQAA